MNYKIAVLGGGTGMSVLLRGLKKFPVDITAIVGVADDGYSTGKLRKEFHIPAVGDLRKVIISLSETEPLVEKLFNYRFSTTSDLDGHAVGNLLLTALTNITGNLSDGIESFSKLLNLKGKVVPLTEEQVTLAAIMDDKSIVEGEYNITKSDKKIKKIYYKKNPIVNETAVKCIKEADLIILSMGSIYTSIIPNLLCKKIQIALDETNAKILYTCNMMTQPGETDNFKVSDHVKLLNKYLNKHKIDVVLANDQKIDENIRKKYETLEQKDPVLLDKENIKGIKIISSNLFIVENGVIRHDSLKLALNIFSYLLEQKKTLDKLKYYIE